MSNEYIEQNDTKLNVQQKNCQSSTFAAVFISHAISSVLQIAICIATKSDTGPGFNSNYFHDSCKNLHHHRNLQSCRIAYNIYN